jgi:hypothetical protein
MKPSRSFIKWLNSTQRNSPLFYLVKDDPAVEKAREEADIAPKTEEEKEKEDKTSMRKLQQTVAAIND